MRAVNRFLRLDSVERVLLLEAFVLVCTASTSVRLLPFAIVQKLFANRAKASNTHRRSIERSMWAIAVAGKYMPGTTCLSLALAAHRMLHREGYPAHLYIGVGKDHVGSFRAHAWVESEGKIVIGGQDSSSSFAPLGVIGCGKPL